MDLIAQLSQTLGVSDSSSKAAAGAILGLVQEKMAEADPDMGGQLKDKIPELDDWKVAADAEAGTTEDPGFLGGLAGAFGGAGGLLGEVGKAADTASDLALVAGVLKKVGLDSDKASMAAPLVLKFLESRLPPELLDKAKMAAPFLGIDVSPAGGAASMLGSLLGR